MGNNEESDIGKAMDVLVDVAGFFMGFGFFLEAYHEEHRASGAL